MILWGCQLAGGKPPFVLLFQGSGGGKHSALQYASSNSLSWWLTQLDSGSELLHRAQAASELHEERLQGTATKALNFLG